MIRKIAAHYVFPINDKPIKNGILTIDQTGKILDISKSNENLTETAGMEFYSGILVPGFVNTHCHLELSHLKSKVPKHTGLANFVLYINQFRQNSEENIIKAAKKADTEMWFNGIVAVGDISNTSYSFKVKNESKITYHSFLEIFSTNPDLTKQKYDQAKELEKQLNTLGLSSSIVPHAPYTVPANMFKLISDHALKNKKPVSIHNQECASENELYQSKSGELFDSFTKQGVDFSAIPCTGKNSLESIMVQMPKTIKTLLVHNTFSKKEDIEKASGYFEDLYWAFCPNANLYIENSFPDVSLFHKMKQKITLGTDSLSSNDQLSILEEIKIINQNYPDIPVTELLKWASLNGAEALDLADKIGSFEVGKNPGVNLIDNFDFKNFKFTPESKLERLN